MNKEFIPYEQALELKELGFDEECISSWLGNDYMVPHRNWQKGNEKYISAPLYQQAFRWFREKYDLASQIHPMVESESKQYVWHYMIRNINEYLTTFDIETWANTYEEAELACLIKLIEIVKQKQ